MNRSSRPGRPGNIAKLPPVERSAVLGKIGAMPRAVLGFLETHPRTLTTAAGVAVVMAIKDDVIGDKGKSVVLADGRVSQYSRPCGVD